MRDDHDAPASTDAVAARLQRALGDDFRLERELGGGGMSRVFLAHDHSLSRDVVVKVLPEDVAEAISRERFRREVLLSANLQHPNIVGVIAAGDAEGLPYFVMPFVDGESLRARLTSEGTLSVPLTVSILRDVARALSFAHERGVVHRDIKPDNVLLAGGAAIVADFGVAKALATSRRRRDHPHGTITTAGISLGTPAYMAPEQVAGDPQMDHRADLYALGAMTYELLTGHPPFAGRGMTELMQAHLVERPAPMARTRAGIPAALEALVMECLEKEPGRRPADAGELLRRLDDPAVVSGAVSSAAQPSIAIAVSRPVGAWRWMVGALALVLVTAAVVLALLPSPPSASLGTPTGAGAVIGAPGVAVLPLVSVSADSADAYLALGMTDEITSALARLQGLRVASRSAASAAQAEGGGVAEVARRLGVSFLLEGTVQRSGTQLRVAVRLVDAKDGFSAWSEVYDRSTADLLAVQADIATRIAAAVGDDVSAGSGDDERLLSEAESRDPDAYQDYLRGTVLLARRDARSLAGATDAFEGAVARDPGFARAYAGLAQAHALLSAIDGTPAGEDAQRSLFAAQRALALDSTVSAAHAALGFLYNRQWRWGEGRSALERALALDSTDVSAGQWLAENLLVNGDAAGAIRRLDAVVRRHPESSGPRAVLATALAVAGERERALVTARDAVALDTTSTFARERLAALLLDAGRAAEAVAVLSPLVRRGDGEPLVLGTLGAAQARLGRTAEARAILGRLEGMASRAGAYLAMARVHLGLGEVDRALDALTWATASRDERFASESLASPLFAPLRGDPRFARVVGFVGLDRAVLGRTASAR